MYEATFAFMDIVISEHGHDHKMVELRSVDDNLADIAVSAPVGSATNPLPTATKVSLYPIPIYPFSSQSKIYVALMFFKLCLKVMVEQPDVWYKKFSRNIHGLRSDKPYTNLKWPPEAPPK